MRNIDHSYQVNMHKYNRPGISRGTVYSRFLVARIRSDIDKGMHLSAVNEAYLEKIMQEYRYPQQLRDIILGRLSISESSRYKYFKTIIFEATRYAFPYQQYCYNTNDSTFMPQVAPDLSARPPQSQSPRVYAPSSYSPTYFKPTTPEVKNVRQEQNSELEDEKNTNFSYV
jgi:hypothetical protein